jgi:hypothetical protein
MPRFEVSVPHELDQKEALSRIRNTIEDLQSKFGNHVSDLRENWTKQGATYSFTVMGFSVSGTLDVSSSEVRVAGALPFAALPLKGRIESTVRENLQKMLA